MSNAGGRLCLPLGKTLKVTVLAAPSPSAHAFGVRLGAVAVGYAPIARSSIIRAGRRIVKLFDQLFAGFALLRTLWLSRRRVLLSHGFPDHDLVAGPVVVQLVTGATSDLHALVAAGPVAGLADQGTNAHRLASYCIQRVRIGRLHVEFHARMLVE